jgi:hypothetical protein
MAISHSTGNKMSEEATDKYINPESWTEKELLKHMYREFLELKAIVVELVKAGVSAEKVSIIEAKIKTLEAEILVITTIQAERENSLKRQSLILRNVSIAVGIIGTIAVALLWVLNLKYG